MMAQNRAGTDGLHDSLIRQIREICTFFQGGGTQHENANTPRRLPEHFATVAAVCHQRPTGTTRPRRLRWRFRRRVCMQ